MRKRVQIHDCIGPRYKVAPGARLPDLWLGLNYLNVCVFCCCSKADNLIFWVKVLDFTTILGFPQRAYNQQKYWISKCVKRAY